MDKLEVKLKECCLTCEHFYLDTGKIGIMGCGPCGPRELACLHMLVCGKYMENRKGRRLSYEMER